MGSGIEPCIACPHNLHIQLPGFEVKAVHVGNLKLSPLGGSDSVREFDNLLIVKIDTGDCIAGLGLGGLLVECFGSAILAE